MNAKIIRSYINLDLQLQSDLKDGNFSMFHQKMFPQSCQVQRNNPCFVAKIKTLLLVALITFIIFNSLTRCICCEFLETLEKKLSLLREEMFLLPFLQFFFILF